MIAHSRVSAIKLTFEVTSAYSVTNPETSYRYDIEIKVTKLRFRRHGCRFKRQNRRFFEK